MVFKLQFHIVIEFDLRLNNSLCPSYFENNRINSTTTPHVSLQYTGQFLHNFVRHNNNNNSSSVTAISNPPTRRR